MSITEHINQAVLDMASVAARNAAPKESCGLLLSVAGSGVDMLVLSDNTTDGDPTKTFEIDPEMLIACQKAERMGGAKVLGVWHSHPGGEAVPSDADKARSEHAGWLWLITAVKGDDTEHGLYVAGDCAQDITKA